MSFSARMVKQTAALPCEGLCAIQNEKEQTPDMCSNLVDSPENDTEC